MGLAPELIHKVALEGWLGVRDVGVLGLVCRRMADILVWDEYGRELHMALRGVVENVRERRWKAAMYAVKRRWFGGEEGGEEGVWRAVVGAVVGDVVEMKKNDVVEGEDDKTGWEHVLLASLSLPRASGYLEPWVLEIAGWERETTLLHIAVGMGSERLVEWVLERGGGSGGGNVEEKNERNSTALQLAVECCDGVGIVRMLVEAGADVGVKGYQARSLLHLASMRGRGNVVEYLLGLGVFGVDDQDEGGDTPLEAACECGHTNVVRILLEKGADVDVEGRKMECPLYRACSRGHAEIVRLVVEAGGCGGVDMGEDKGVWVEAMNDAARYGFVDVVEALLEAGVGVEGRDQDGNRALLVASRGGCLEVVRVLLEVGGADVEGVGGGGKTPLYVACWHGHPEVVEVLLDAGAQVGREEEDVARRRGHDCVLDVLAAR